MGHQFSARSSKYCLTMVPSKRMQFDVSADESMVIPISSCFIVVAEGSRRDG